MAYLKYYREEAETYPFHNGFRLNSDQALFIVETAFAERGLAPIRVRFQDSRRWEGTFRWNWLIPGRLELGYNRTCSIRTVLHELAHYVDYVGRQAEIQALKDAGIADHRDLCARIRKIRKQRFHGPLHRAAMADLVAWFDIRFAEIRQKAA